MTGRQDPDAIFGFTPEEFESGINLIFYLAMIIIPLNIAGSTYVLTRVLSVTFKNHHGVIPASLRLPFYIVFIDMLCSFTFTAEMIHLYLARIPPKQPYAAILGGCVTFVLVCNFVLVAQAAFFSWNRIVLKKVVSYGPYDVKLIAPAIFVAATVVVVFASIGALGANNYICWVRKSAYGAALFIVICCLVSIIALWVFYVWIMVEIFKLSQGSFVSFVKSLVSFRPSRPQFKQETGSDMTQSTQELSLDDSDLPGSQNMSSGSSQISIVERQFIMKICMYMLACFIQYLPGIPYASSYLLPRQPYALYVSAVISINLGGVVNATALILNEGLGQNVISSEIGGGASTSYYPTNNGEWATTAGGASNWGRPFAGTSATQQSEARVAVRRLDVDNPTVAPGPGYSTSPPRLYPPRQPIRTEFNTRVKVISREMR
ncbi:hypothetical protein BJ742DRAFT_792258 [Cladochytrium replicatum]|nr:hypothetical protein BJ742DRAFT_792258 [Cladochytrium replicatum]